MKAWLTFVVGGVLGLAGGFALGIFAVVNFGSFKESAPPACEQE